MKKYIKTILTISLTVGITLFMAALLLRPQCLTIDSIHLHQISDGEYIGICQNKLLFAVVSVTVEDHIIQKIEILEHKESYMTQAYQIANEVITKQSIDVDSISHATFTSDTVLKAIENALNREN